MNNENIKKDNIFTNIIDSIVYFFKKDLTKYVLKRIMSGLVTLILLVATVFLLLRLIPKENYLDFGLKQKMNALTWKIYSENIFHKYGFDKPVFSELFKFLTKILPFPKKVCVDEFFSLDTGDLICGKYLTRWIDLGTSLAQFKGKTVTELLAKRFPISFKVGFIVLIISYAIAYPMGVFMAKFKGGIVDKIGNAYIVLIAAIPSIVLYYCFMLLNFKLHIPVIYNVDKPITMLLPITAGVFMAVPGIMLYVRRFMVDEMNSEYVKFARSKGLSENKILFKHVLRNAMVPIIRNIPGSIIACLTGAYFMEKLWAIPGAGNLLILSMNNAKPDNPLVQGIVIVYAMISMVSFLLGDIVTVLFDPRISITKK